MQKKKLNNLIKNLDHKDRMDRKIKFLLDIRGYFFVNKIKGDYVEFGVFNGEMIYCANQIFKNKYNFTKYIGLDTFEGTPLKKNNDKINKYISKGDYKSSIKNVKKDLSNIKNLELIKGDFREKIVSKKFQFIKPKISLLVIDCNLLSSINSSLNLGFKYVVNGSVLYFDDMYVSQSNSLKIKDQLNKIAKNHHLVLEPYMFYPPFGRAFFLFKKK